MLLFPNFTEKKKKMKKKKNQPKKQHFALSNRQRTYSLLFKIIHLRDLENILPGPGQQTSYKTLGVSVLFSGEQ